MLQTPLSSSATRQMLSPPVCYPQIRCQELTDAKETPPRSLQTRSLQRTWYFLFVRFDRAIYAILATLCLQSSCKLD
jgi:hypothetical protein